MRTADRLAAGSDPPGTGLGLLGSLALHGGALAVVLAGLTGAATPPGQGEPTAIEVMFVPGPPVDATQGVEEAAAESGSPTAPAEPVAEAETARDVAGPAEAASMPLPDAPAHEAQDVIETASLAAPEPVETPPPEPAPEPVQTASLPLPPRPPPRSDVAYPEAPRPTARPARSPPHPATPLRAGRPGSQPVAGLPDAEGQPAPPADRGPILVRNPGFRRPPAPPADRGPILVRNPGFRRPPAPPAYPRQAVARGIEGTVLLRALIGPDGETIEVRLHRSSGAVLLDQAAIEAVRRWAFRPASVGGHAVPAWVEVPVRFRLD
jgi:protein TonB